MAIHIGRRDLLGVLAGAAAVPMLAPQAARAQQPMPVVGYLNSGSPEAFAHLVSGFRKGLAEAGYVEGRNVAIEYRWANDQLDRLPDLATDLVRRKVAVITAVGSFAPAFAAKTATATIPIVFVSGGDPVARGLVASLSHPGGNVTGVTGLSGELAAKQIGLLHELSPTASRVAVLVNPVNPQAETSVHEAKAAAAAIGLQIEVAVAPSSHDIDAAFADMKAKHVAGLVVLADNLMIGRRVQLAILAVKYALPTVFPFPENAASGGLMSYGPDTVDTNRLVGIYTGRILKGERPVDLPVMQASKLELVINLPTAKAMGIDIPTSLLARADEVIE
jgi:putative ABC transport system substrate-binding protein